jgi:hypothetical protein
MVGGCKRTGNTESFTVWYYPPETEQDIDCGSSATKIPPQ